MIDVIRGSRALPDGRTIWLLRMLYNWRIAIGPADLPVYDDEWCYRDATMARQILETWDGEGEPLGWNKHPSTGRWREDGTPGSEVSQRRGLTE